MTLIVVLFYIYKSKHDLFALKKCIFFAHRKYLKCEFEHQVSNENNADYLNK